MKNYEYCRVFTHLLHKHESVDSSHFGVFVLQAYGKPFNLQYFNEPYIFLTQLRLFAINKSGIC